MDQKFMRSWTTIVLGTAVTVLLYYVQFCGLKLNFETQRNFVLLTPDLHPQAIPPEYLIN